MFDFTTPAPVLSTASTVAYALIICGPGWYLLVAEWIGSRTR